MLAATNAKRNVLVGAFKTFKPDYPRKTAREMLDVCKQGSFYIIIANRSNSVIKPTEYQCVAGRIPQPSEIIDIKNNEYVLYSPSISSCKYVNYVHYKPAPNRFQQMKEHETVELNDDDCLNNEWQEELTIPDKYKEQCPKLLRLMDEFADLWHERLGRSKAAKHCIELTDNHVRSVHRTAYRARTTTIEFAVIEIYKLLQGEAIEPATTEWASSTVLATKKDSSLCFLFCSSSTDGN